MIWKKKKQPQVVKLYVAYHFKRGINTGCGNAWTSWYRYPFSKIDMELITEDIKKNGGFDSIVILNIIPLVD